MHVAGLRAMKIKKFIGASYSSLQNEIVLDYMTAAGFEALSICFRESVLRLIMSTTLAIWSMERPSGAGHERHCEP